MDLAAVLAVDDDDDGVDSTHKVLGTRLRAEKQFDLEEQRLLEEEGLQPDGLMDTEESDEQ